MPHFPEITYDNSLITKAGKSLMNANSGREEIEKAEMFINEWRSYHFCPIMGIQATLRNHVKKIHDSQSIVVQRLKKMQTIKDKLRRFPTMRLHTMQDIGGCRAVLSNCQHVYKLYESLKKSTMRHKIVDEKDYINNPKDSGYRGIHLIMKYNGKVNRSYNGLKVEIQIRTHLQHLWATAVETVGIFINNSLKSSAGSEVWLRFFQLISSLIALEEDCNTVPNTPNIKENLINEINKLDQENSIFNVLSTINATCNYLQHQKIHKKHYYVITIKKDSSEVDVGRYRSFSKANMAYIKAEQNFQNNAVLVFASSFDALRKAYPNYFMNVTEFLKLTQELIKGDGL